MKLAESIEGEIVRLKRDYLWYYPDLEPWYFCKEFNLFSVDVTIKR